MINRTCAACVVCLLTTVTMGPPLIRAQTAMTTGSATLYVATFVDLMPQHTAAGTKAIQQYVADSRKDPGSVRMEAIAQVGGRENHLVIYEVWRDQQAFDAHEATANTKDFRTRLLPLIGAPFDQRLHHLVP